MARVRVNVVARMQRARIVGREREAGKYMVVILRRDGVDGVEWNSWVILCLLISV